MTNQTEAQRIAACRDCRYREPDTRPEYEGAGHCRRYPPQINIWAGTDSYDRSQANFEQHWPWMAATDWCGEFAPGNALTGGQANG